MQAFCYVLTVQLARTKCAAVDPAAVAASYMILNACIALHNANTVIGTL